MTEQVLGGVKVVEYCSMVAGPYCAKLLADLGAEVVKVEPPGGEAARQRGPLPGDTPHPEKSALFLYVNTNKLGVTLNLETDKGRELFGELVKRADVLIEDTAPSRSQELGISYGALSAINPRLVMVSITPFGRTGPYRDYKAYSLNSFHGGGEGYLLPGGVHNLKREPLKGAGFLSDYDCAVCTAVATLGTLYHSQLTGRGQHIDVSRQETATALARVDVARYLWDGVVESRATRGPRPGSTIRCKDGHVQIHCPGDHQWEALKTAMGNPAWAEDPKYKDRPSRVKYVDELNAGVEEWSKALTTDEVTERVQAKGCPGAPYKTVPGLLKDEQLKYRGFFREIERAEVGALNYPTVAYSFPKTPVVYRQGAPLLGEHNRLVFGQRLGYSDGDLLKLREAGVI